MPDAFDKLLRWLLAFWAVTILAVASKYTYIAYRDGLEVTAVFLFSASLDIIVAMGALFVVFLAVATVCKLAEPLRKD